MRSKICLVMLVGAIAALNIGCASMASYNASEREIGMKIAKGKNDTQAVHLMTMGSSAIGVGIEVNNWDAFWAHPFRQTGAAILDVGTAYGLSKLLENYTSNSSKKEVNITGNGNSYNETTGDGNTSTHSNENDSHNAP